MKTRQEAIAAQQNSVIKAALERMTDEQYAAHKAKMEQARVSGAMGRTIKAEVRRIMR